MISIDEFLLEKTQKLCDKFTTLTGDTKFRIEMWVVVLQVVFFWIFATQHPKTSILVLAVIFTLFKSLWIISLRNQEKVFLKDNKLRQSWACKWVRYLALGFLIMGIIEILVPGYLFYVLFTCAIVFEVYIAACLPRPSGKVKYENGLVQQ